MTDIGTIVSTKEYEHEWRGFQTKVLLFGQPNNFISLHSNVNALNTVTAHAQKHGILKIFAPKVTSANKLIAQEHDFKKEIVCNGVSVFHGIAADGVLIPPRSAFFIASADCPTLVLQDSQGSIVATHAGRQCLLDSASFLGGRQHRFESVIDEALQFLWDDPAHIHASVFCGIGQEHFTHPIEHFAYGDVNEAMIKYVVKRWGRDCFGPDLTQGQLSLFELIKAQLKESGVSIKHIWHDGACTYSDLISPLKHMWWSHRRGDKGRNGVLVMRIE